MATKISTELLILILNNVHSTQDLYSSLLVNRIWCKVTIPILWKLPLSQECCMDDKNLRNKALCIRTYISCMDTQARTLLTQNGFDLSSSPHQAAFDYPSFTHKFIINNLVYFISIYSQQQTIGLGHNNNNNRIILTSESRILFREICTLIIKRCEFLDHFKLAGVLKKFFKNFYSYSDLIGSILELPGAPKVFKKLESLTLTIRDELICPLYKSLKLICYNILNMNLSLFSYSQAQLLAELISAQKRLENLSIIANGIHDHDLIFWAIISQKETLKSLCLKTVNFYYFERKASPIEQFISLQELYIEDCYGLQKPDSLLFASSFTQLISFRYLHSDPYTRYPQEFILKILETANANLKNICLDLFPTIKSDILSAILNCTKVTKLTLHNSTPEQIMAIFDNNFNELRRFSFFFNCEEFDSNELLCQMAENVPESLETIEISMGIFSADSLRKFLEGWCCKGRGENKKIIVKRIEQARLFILSDEHNKVIEEYGVQFNIEA